MLCRYQIILFYLSPFSSRWKKNKKFPKWKMRTRQKLINPTIFFSQNNLQFSQYQDMVTWSNKVIRKEKSSFGYHCFYMNAFQQFCERREEELKNFFWSRAWWERGGKFLEGGGQSLEILIMGFTSRLLFNAEAYWITCHGLLVICHFSLSFSLLVIFLWQNSWQKLFTWNSAPREELNFHFQGVFC